VAPFSSTSGAGTERIDSAVRDRSDGLTKTQLADAEDPMPERRYPSLALGLGKPEVTGADGASSSKLGEVSAFAAQPSMTTQAKTLQGLPANWKGALEAARNRSNSERSVTDVPSPELYALRVRNLRDAMVALNPGGIFAVVHVKKDSGNATVEVHETDESATGEVICRVCCARHTWQLALSCGLPPADPLYPLFPATRLGKGNFAAGYSALVDDLPSSLFSTEAYDPAQLKLQDPHSATYTVSRKMTLKQVASGRN
jgi:hypothetical protein